MYLGKTASLPPTGGKSACVPYPPSTLNVQVVYIIMKRLYGCGCATDLISPPTMRRSTHGSIASPQIPTSLIFKNQVYNIRTTNWFSLAMVRRSRPLSPLWPLYRNIPLHRLHTKCGTWNGHAGTLEIVQICNGVSRAQTSHKKAVMQTLSEDVWLILIENTMPKSHHNLLNTATSRVIDPVISGTGSRPGVHH